MSQVVYGFHPVVELLQSGQAIEKVLIAQDMRGEQEKALRQLCREVQVPLLPTPRERLNKLVRGNHQGVIALQSMVTFQQIGDVLPLVFESGEVPLLFILDHVTDVRNFGAIARSAWTMGAHALIVPSSGAAAMNEDAMKASAGALSHIPVCREKSLFNTLDFLKDSGVQVVATALGAQSVHISDIDLTLPTAIILGSEGEGVHPKLLKESDRIAMIPQARSFDSLNVSVAAGVVLYEAHRQRTIR